MKTTVTLEDGMHFVGEIDGYQVPMDAGVKGGGQHKGPSPKQLTLISLGGCTGMDVIGILRKMRAEPEALSVEVETEITDTHPKVFKWLRLTYRVKGNVPLEKVERAVILSQDQYCGVSAMLKAAVPMEWSVVIED